MIRTMCNIKKSGMIMLAAHLFVLILMFLLFFKAAGFVNSGPSPLGVCYLTQMDASIDGGPSEKVQLPISFTDLEARTPVTLKTTICPKRYDTVYIKSVYAPARVYLDGVLAYEFGKPENYPSFMKDPATEVHMVETNGRGEPMELRIDFESPSTRSILAVQPPIVGSSKEVILERLHALGAPFILSVAQVIYGLSLLIISVCILFVDKKGLSFLWLGLVSLMSGIWALGENNFTGIIFKNATLLYLMSFIGFFTFAIPLLRFTRTVVDFENPRPIWYMELFVAITSGIALLLQLTGALAFSASLYFFHLVLPPILVILTGCTIWEAVHYQNGNARRFSMPLAILALTSVLELVNYRINFTYVFSSLFQMGILFFLLIMGVTAGLAVKESVDLKDKQKELNFEKGLIEIQVKEQAGRGQLLSQHEELLSQQRHDLRHHLNAIIELAGDNPPLQEYLQNLTDQIPKADRRYCENRTVNAVVSHYADLCRQKDIDLELQVAVPSQNVHVDDNKLCVIFGNLLENAVEACDRMTEGRRFIQLNSRVKKDILVITMDNSFNGQIRRLGKRFISSKREAYGIGLTSIRSVALENGGEAQFEGVGDVFKSNIYFHL